MEVLSLNIPITSKPRIVVIGGGFAGIEFVRKLAKVDGQVILIDRNNYHTFQPLLYQVATAALEPSSIAYPFREIFKKQQNFLFRMAEVEEIVSESNILKTSIGDIGYDYLVIASGSKTNYFGVAEFEKYCIPMKSIPESIRIRNLILENMEKSLLVKNIEERERLMNIVIVGGGATGVEMAGALGELKKHILPNDYPELDFKRMQIHIVDVADRLMPFLSKESSESALKFLKRFDINFWLTTKVVAYDGVALILSNGKKILTDTVIWAAGVAGTLIPGLKQAIVLPGNRIQVDTFNKVAGYSNIFAVGDAACVVTDKTSKGHPMLAPVAIQQARNLAQNFYRFLKNQAPKSFVYKDAGVMATVGRNHAVADFKFFKFRGTIAWFIWVFVHLMTLVGFRNRLIVLVNWAWNYFTFDRSLRFIFKPVKK